MKKTTEFKDLALSHFCMQTAMLLKSGIPLSDGMMVMAEDSQTEAQKEILSLAAQKLSAGIPLSTTLKESDAFPEYVIKMVQLGEMTGNTDLVMERLSIYYEREFYLAENLKKALTYPCVLIFMLLGILLILFNRVMPVFERVYEQFGLTISPVLNYLLLAVNVLIFLVCIAAVIGFFVLLIQTKKHSGSSAGILTPLYQGKTSIAQNSARRRLCDVTGMILRCGVPILDGLKQTEDLVQNPFLKEKIIRCENELLAGNSFYEAVKKAEIFSGFDLQMVRVSSRTGQLDRIMDELADDYEQRTEQEIRHMISIIEPAVVIVLAAAVGIVLLTVMLPLVSILSSVGV